MKNRTKFIINSVLLAAVGVAMRAVNVSFMAYVTKKVGAGAVGLFTLVGSVYGFAVTLCLSGVNLAAVRLVSKRAADCKAHGIHKKALRRELRREMQGCIAYGLFFGTLAAVLLFIFSKPIGIYALDDVRTVSSLRAAAAALPAISLSSALAGYFTGMRKVVKNALISVGEQFISISLISALLVYLMPRGEEYACLAVIGGGAIAEGASLIISFLLYITDRGEGYTRKRGGETAESVGAAGAESMSAAGAENECAAEKKSERAAWENVGSPAAENVGTRKRSGHQQMQPTGNNSGSTCADTGSGAADARCGEAGGNVNVAVQTACVQNGRRRGTVDSAAQTAYVQNGRQCGSARGKTKTAGAQSNTARGKARDDSEKQAGTPNNGLRGAVRRTAEIALPTAVGSYVRQGLICAEHIAIPRGLKKFGGSGEAALTSYGVLHGMTFPLIFFPSSVVAAAASLLIPELSEAAALRRRGDIKRIAEQCVRLTLIFAAFIGALFLAYGEALGERIYSSADAGAYAKLIAPLIPVMYLDTAVDCVLKGIGEQVYCMKVNIIDAALSLILVLTVLPHFGLYGYIFCVYLTEIVNFTLSITKMIRAAGARLRVSFAALPLLCSFAAFSLIRAAAPYIGGGLPFEISASIAVYSVLLLSVRLVPKVIHSKKQQAKKPVAIPTRVNYNK